MLHLSTRKICSDKRDHLRYLRYDKGLHCKQRCIHASPGMTSHLCGAAIAPAYNTAIDYVTTHTMTREPRDHLGVLVGGIVVESGVSA